jgi:hypothetical protein
VERRRDFQGTHFRKYVGAHRDAPLQCSEPEGEIEPDDYVGRRIAIVGVERNRDPDGGLEEAEFQPEAGADGHEGAGSIDVDRRVALELEQESNLVDNVDTRGGGPDEGPRGFPGVCVGDGYVDRGRDLGLKVDDLPGLDHVERGDDCHRLRNKQAGHQGVHRTEAVGRQLLDAGAHFIVDPGRRQVDVQRPSGVDLQALLEGIQAVLDAQPYIADHELAGVVRRVVRQRHFQTQI